MKIAERILSKINVEEKVENNYFDDASFVEDLLTKNRSKLKNSEFKKLYSKIHAAISDLGLADEAGSIKNLEASIDIIKKQKIEEEVN